MSRAAGTREDGSHCMEKALVIDSYPDFVGFAGGFLLGNPMINLWVTELIHKIGTHIEGRNQ
jgi:hypothetical protein